MKNNNNNNNRNEEKSAIGACRPDNVIYRGRVRLKNINGG